MKFIAQKNDLNRALQMVQSAVARRTTMPILSNVLLSVSSEGLRLSASDLELSAVALVKGKGSSMGKTTINARVFGDIVRELPEGEVILQRTDGERLDITAKGSKFKIIGVSAEEYPTLPGVGLDLKGKVAASVFLSMIEKTLYAASTDETRFNLNGVCFEMIGTQSGAKRKDKSKASEGPETSQSQGPVLRMVATDGHRLSMSSRPVEALSFDGRVIIPRRALAEMRRVLEGEGDKSVGIGIEEGFFLLETPQFKLSARLIDGEYPDYGQVLPKEKGTVAELKNEDLSQALKRVMLVVTDREKGVRLNFAESVLRIMSSSPELGEASEEIEVKFKGEPLTIGFNAQYVLEAALGLTGSAQALRIDLHGESGPARFFLEEDESSMAIVMPMRL